jgi:hypothetical protein
MNLDDPAIRVCIYCGSPRPEELLPQCAHGIVATVRGNERRAAARLFVDFQTMHASRAAFITKLGLAVEKGTATIDHAPAFDHAGDNVVPLHDRDVLVTPSDDGGMAGWEFDALFSHRRSATEPER